MPHGKPKGLQAFRLRAHLFCLESSQRFHGEGTLEMAQGQCKAFSRNDELSNNVRVLIFVY